MTKKNATKLDQLTSLRFFAAMMIVVHHSAELFGVGKVGILWGQGVSFFFVLSGFILTYVYSKLDSWQDVGRFWRARVARIWPAYFASFLLGLWLIPYSLKFGTTAEHLLMVQAWIPVSKSYFSYNAVAWSVSTEVFFYLAFPFLIYQWAESWQSKLALSFAVLVGLIVTTNVLALPDYGHPGIGDEGLLVTRHGLIYISPLSRIFEFIVGMSVALVWKKNAPRHSFALATGYELAAIALCAASMFFMSSFAQWSQGTFLGPSTALWLLHSGSVFAFGALIFVLAYGRGCVSRLLNLPVFVLLGEISFSIYLVHQILLNFYGMHVSHFIRIASPIAFVAFLAVLLLSSYLMWVFVEMPGRRLILGRTDIHGSKAMAVSWRSNTPLSFKPFLAVVAIVGIVAIVLSKGENSEVISAKEADGMTPSHLKSYTGTKFDKFFALRGLSMACEQDGMHLKLAWENIGVQTKPYSTAIHLVDGAGLILDQADHRHSLGELGSKPDVIRLKAQILPASKFKENTAALAIGLYDDSVALLPIDRGPTDWGDRRLIIPVAKCPASAPR